MLQSHPELNTRPAPAASRVGMCSVKARESEILRGGFPLAEKGAPKPRSAPPVLLNARSPPSATAGDCSSQPEPPAL